MCSMQGGERGGTLVRMGQTGGALAVEGGRRAIVERDRDTGSRMLTSCAAGGGISGSVGGGVWR